MNPETANPETSVLPRQHPSTQQIAAAFPGCEQVIDFQQVVRPGRLPSVFHAYLVRWPAPRRPTLVQVFPYRPADEQRAVIQRLLEFEERCWGAWWRRVARQPPGHVAVYPVAPLVVSQTEAIGQREIATDVGPLFMGFRPFLEWPDLRECAFPRAQRLLLWERFRRDAQAIAGELGVALEIAPAPDRVDRQRLLSDGRHLVCTRWRDLHPVFRALDAERVMAGG